MKTTQGDLGLETPQEFSSRLGLSFQDLSLLTRALTHRSYRNENDDALEDNERLEFLGDAVLDFIVATWIYHHFPEMSEGQLTRLRSALVNKDQLAEFGLQVGIDKVVPTLQDALVAASNGDEILVAEGVYKPDEGGGQK